MEAMVMDHEGIIRKVSKVVEVDLRTMDRAMDFIKVVVPVEALEVMAMMQDMDMERTIISSNTKEGDILVIVMAGHSQRTTM
jgi:hypothetical protein